MPPRYAHAIAAIAALGSLARGGIFHTLVAEGSAPCSASHLRQLPPPPRHYCRRRHFIADYHFAVIAAIISP